MRILALETTDQTGSAALLDDDRIVAATRLRADQRSAQSLAPAMQALLAQAAWKPAEIELVGVAIGPGSFTGLRVGVTTAKTFAHAVAAKIVGLNTLEIVAAQAPAEIQQVAVVVDAQRGQLFAARLERVPSGQWRWLEPTAIVDATAWLASLEAGFSVSGLGLKTLPQPLPASVRVLPEDLWLPQAETVGRLARQRAQAGLFDNVAELVPLYFRRSAAEEQREKKKAEGGRMKAEG
jgi:tRNA threonylcarbamoyladenosine biosynthesis protein TsaB